MTIAVRTPMSRPSDHGVSWRALRRDLWVARRDGKHLGTIEHGRRWVATDADGEPIAAFRSFQEAQDAVVDPAAPRPPVPRASASAPMVAVLGLCAAALVSAAGWASTALLF